MNLNFSRAARTASVMSDDAMMKLKFDLALQAMQDTWYEKRGSEY